MKRRNFLLLSSILSLPSYLQAKKLSPFEKEFKKVEPILSAVQEHMFPPNAKLPSATSMKMTQFLLETMRHHSYDKDIRAFVIEGAKELNRRTKNKFFKMTPQEKEKALREYEKSNYGNNWLSRILTLSMEAIFCDPIYGSNINQEGWKALGAIGGFPRPQKAYLGV